MSNLQEQGCSDARLVNSQDPRAFGQALPGPDLHRYWKYRIGDYRVIAEIRDR